MVTEPMINGPPLEMPQRALVVIGKCGVGKSNLTNRLANLDWPTDPVVPCSRKPALKVMTRDEFPRLAVPTAWLVDLPGFAEGLVADETYRGFYRTWLPCASDLLWLVQADSRAYKRDELFLDELLPLVRPGARLRVVLTRVDCLALEADTPHDGRPTPGQLQHLGEKIEDVFSLFAAVIDGRVPFQRADILPCSVKTGWGFDRIERLLFNEKE
jgi:predicted GTPase